MRCCGTAIGILALAGALAPLCQAQIAPDASLGTRAALSGTQWSITGGRPEGANLFHSFSQFGVNTGQTATFSGAATVSNIIARVTGTTPSVVDGVLRSDIMGASLWLINPNGVAFGPNASLSISGSFHVSTADYVKLGTAEFHSSLARASTFSSAPPTAFGFLAASPAPVIGIGARMRAGADLSIVAGDIAMDGASFSAPGRIRVASVAGAGEVALEGPLATSEGQTLGRMVLVSSEIRDSSNHAIIEVRAGRLELAAGSRIETDSGPAGTGSIDVFAAESISVHGIGPGPFPVASGIFATARGTGARGGTVRVRTGRLELSDYGTIASATVFRAGDSGDVEVEARTISITTSGSIEATSMGLGKAGRVLVKATESLTLDGAGADVPSDTTIGAGSLLSPFGLSGGDAGRVEVRAPLVRVANGALIGTTSETVGKGGDILVSADRVELAGGGRISAESTDIGTSGAITVEARQSLTLASGGRISATTTTADAGNITVRVGDLVHLDASQITTSVAGGAGGGGDIIIDPTFVVLDNGSRIVAQAARGSGGNISIVTEFFLASANSVVSASSEEGISGQVTISSPRVDLAGALRVLPTNFLDASSLLRASCGSRAGNANSFLAAGRGGLAAAPAAPASASARQALASRCF